MMLAAFYHWLHAAFRGFVAKIFVFAQRAIRLCLAGHRRNLEFHHRRILLSEYDEYVLSLSYANEDEEKHPILNPFVSDRAGCFGACVIRSVQCLLRV